MAPEDPAAAADGQAPAPYIPLRDVVIMPGVETKLVVGRPHSVAALAKAQGDGDGLAVFVTQRRGEVDQPRLKDLYSHGCLARIVRDEEGDGGVHAIVVEGFERVEILRLAAGAERSRIECVYRVRPTTGADGAEARELADRLRALLPPQARRVKASDLGRFADLVALDIAGTLGVAGMQGILEASEVSARLRLLLAHCDQERDIDHMAESLLNRSDYDAEAHRREYLQRKAVDIQRSMGEEAAADLEELTRKVEEAGMSAEARAKCGEELARLGTMPSMSPEGSAIRSYLDFMLELPWRERSAGEISLKEARRLLDERHHGLGKVKARILEHIAVQQQVGAGRGSVLCFVGPPGVGKTSLGEVIAAALGRRFARVSLGGIHDESTLRGHRRTYIGSMPGRILKVMAETGVRNPVIMLDEIEKLGRGHNGDPMATLLEIIDPEQNRHFSDHYIEVDFDLSEVMFIATANSMEPMYDALEDRMEFIHLPGYVDGEKIEIARRHLLPRQQEAAGLGGCELEIGDDTLRDLIHSYTFEAGVREFDRCLGRLMRRTVLEQERAGEREAPPQLAIGTAKAREILKAPWLPNDLQREDRPGVVNSLVVMNDMFGDVHQIDGVAIAGDKGVRQTGNMEPMLAQSAETAEAVLRASHARYGLAEDYFDRNGIHVHWPIVDASGDGNSAGLALFVLLVSAANGIPVRMDTAMTGAINLRGEACIVGGLREKLMGACRRGVKRVLFPQIQERELQDVPQEIKEQLELVPVKTVAEVLKHALTRLPAPAKPPARKERRPAPPPGQPPARPPLGA